MKKFFISIIFFFVFVSGFVLVSMANAEEIVKINVSADNKISSLYPANVYKNPGNIYIDIGRCSTYYGDDITRYLAKLDLSSIDKSKDIKSAVFKIDRVSTTWDNDVPTGYALYQITSSYDPVNVTHNTVPSYNITPIASGVKKDYGIFDFDITSLAKEWVDGTIINNGILIKKQDEEVIKYPAYTCARGSFASTDYSSSGSETRPYLEITYYDPSITIDTINSTSPDNITGQIINKGSQLNLAWITKSMGALVIKILDRNNNVVYSVNNDNIYKNAGFVMNYSAGKYRFKIESVNNSSVFAYSPFFFINNPGDATPPSASSNIQVYHNPGDADNAIGFKFTLPSDSDYRMSRIYKSKTAGQLGNEIDTRFGVTGITCSFVDNKPSDAVTCYPYTELEASGIMYYTIKAEDINFNQSTNTEQYPFVFASLVPKSAPTLVSPANNSNISATTIINLTWSYVSDATQYQYKMYDISGKELQSSNLSGGGTGNITGGSFAGEGIYQWNVRACNDTPSDSTCGPWSEKWAFIKGSPIQLSAPIPSSPSNGSTISKGSNSSATQTFVSLSWSSVIGANLYQYKIYSSANQELYSYQTSSTSAGVGLDDGKTYKWKVRACNGTTASDSTCGQWSQQWSFATGSGLSVDLKINDSDNPPSVVYGAKIKVSWTSVGAIKCIPMGHSVPVEGGQPWETGLYNLPLPGGTWTLYAQHSSFGYINPLDIGIQCFDATGKSVADSINLSVNPEINTSPAITVVYPNGGEKLKAGDWWPKITWKRNWMPEGANKKVSITVKKKDGTITQFLAGGVMDEYGLESTIPTWLSTGDYKIIITSDGYGNNLSDESDNYFSIISDSVVSPTPTTQTQELIKSPIDPTVYVIKDGKKQHITSPQEFEQAGYKWDQIKIVQSDLLKQIEELKTQVRQLKEDLAKAGALLKARGSDDVYVVNQDGQRARIKSPEEFSQKGYKWDQIQEVTSDELALIPTMTSGSAPSASQVSAYPNGTLIKSTDNPDVYVIVNGQKRKIPDPATFNNWGYEWNQIKEASAADVNKFSSIEISSDIVRAKGGTKIYRIIGDKKIWIPTVQAFLGSGYKPNTEIDISQDDIADFEDVKYIKVKGGTYVYEIKDNKKYRVTDTSQIPAQDIKPVTLAEFTAYPIGK